MACPGEPLLSCDGKNAKQTKHGGKIQKNYGWGSMKETVMTRLYSKVKNGSEKRGKGSNKSIKKKMYHLKRPEKTELNKSNF